MMSQTTEQNPSFIFKTYPVCRKWSETIYNPVGYKYGRCHYAFIRCYILELSNVWGDLFSMHIYGKNITLRINNHQSSSSFVYAIKRLLYLRVTAASLIIFSIFSTLEHIININAVIANHFK